MVEWSLHCKGPYIPIVTEFLQCSPLALNMCAFVYCSCECVSCKRHVTNSNMTKPLFPLVKHQGKEYDEPKKAADGMTKSLKRKSTGSQARPKKEAKK